MGVYSLASVALGFRASNLTHRGIVSWGPYRFVRHPAYMCKNLAWWIGGIPILMGVFSQDSGNSLFIAFLLAFLTACCWSGIYFLRAITEERHLRSVNGEYDVYCKKVPYRFIP